MPVSYKSNPPGPRRGRPEGEPARNLPARADPRHKPNPQDLIHEELNRVADEQVKLWQSKRLNVAVAYKALTGGPAPLGCDWNMVRAILRRTYADICGLSFRQK